MNLNLVQKLLAQKTGKKPKAHSDISLASLADFLGQDQIAGYLRHCLPDELIGASGVRVLPLDAIQEEMAEGAAPGSFVRPFGYLVVATSISGNAICFHSPSSKVFWADHTSFNTESIKFEDRATGQWKYLYEYSPENVQKALVPLSDNIGTFLEDLLTDRLTAQLDSLD
jgi:hypothetical protein